MTEVKEIIKTLKPGDMAFVSIYDGPSGPARIIQQKKMKKMKIHIIILR